MKKKLKVFFHLIDNFDVSRSITEELIDQIIESDLINNSELFLYCNYDINNYEWLKEKLKNYDNVNYIVPDDRADNWEIGTISDLKSKCDEMEDEKYVLFLHQKGVTKNAEPLMRDWRHLMSYFNIEKWKECVEKMDEGYDTVGVNWKGEGEPPHYSGTYWWAKSSYIKKLPFLKKPSDNGNQCQFFHTYNYRFEGEFWIGLGKPNAYSMHDSNTQHYTDLYPPERYKTS
jgi:hypothetical protein